MLKLRKVELLGFKSFCEKTPITFSGSGITCIIGPNGCGKSNVVDAISWVLGEQSHKMLRAERMSDCIFNGTAKRPPLGIAEVTLTLVDPELSDAVAKVVDGSSEAALDATSRPADDAEEEILQPESMDSTETARSEEMRRDIEQIPNGVPGERKSWKKRPEKKRAMTLRPGEIVIGRRLYRSGQSEYFINGRVARLRDVQEIFMGIGLGPDSYAIIEQGRIGQILNSKPMDRRAIIEEAAGITMYKTKRRLAETKLEASKINLSRVNDILVEVEKQLGSLKRQASKARRYAELREQMRGLLRVVLASKAEHLDIEAVRLENLLREMVTADERQASTVHELEAEHERLGARTYALEGELRHTHNLLGQTALDMDRAENRVTFNQEQMAQLASRVAQLAIEIEQAVRQATDLSARMTMQRETAAALRAQTTTLEATLHESADCLSASVASQSALESHIEELRLLASRLAEESVREQAESQQADQLAERHAASEMQRGATLRAIEEEVAGLQSRVESCETALQQAQENSQRLSVAVGETQTRLTHLRQAHQQTSSRLEEALQTLSAERARHSSVAQILREHAYTADAVQKLFAVNGSSSSDTDLRHDGFRAVGLLADYVEVQEPYEIVIEQFLREELEYVVVETFDHARAGVALLRDKMGGRATFFVDSLRTLNIDTTEAERGTIAGVVARLDRLIEFRDPLGAAAKQFLSKLRSAYLVENAEVAERMARESSQGYFLTADGTCYHGRMVSGGRKDEAGPLALKRELRHREMEVARLEEDTQEQQAALARLNEELSTVESDLSRITGQHFEAEKSLVAAAHQRDEAGRELSRVEREFAAQREEILRLRAEAEAARNRAEQARREHAEAVQSRVTAEIQAAAASEQLTLLRGEVQQLQDRITAHRSDLAALTERFTIAESVERSLVDEISQAEANVSSLRQRQSALSTERAAIESSCETLSTQAQDLRREKTRLEEHKAALEKEWDEARARAGQIEEAVRERRQSLDELRAERGQRQIEKARNDADRDYLRQSCVAELNAQPEELMVQEAELLIGEELVAAETNYNEMKARCEAMGPVNMMALEEFRECEERESFLRRERDDLVQSIENTQLTINELDQVSRQKFEEAFQFINAHFAIAFETLFGGGHGEMRLGEPDSSGEAGIDIVAQPPGKRLQNILLLSGGEKALTALALLIAVFRYQPSPFCILDEVDAPLDEANIGRFNKMLADMCGQTQFIVVTHNRKTMEMGSVLYGVTMQEPGVSKLISVKWEEADAAAEVSQNAAAASNAA